MASSYASHRRRRDKSYSYERFHQRKQFFKLLSHNLARWLVTAALCAAIYAILYSYSSRRAMLARKKKEFNTLIIALTIALGLNIAASLSANAGELRWWILSRRRYSPREADLIMNSHQFAYMLRLGWTTRHMAIQIFVLSFVGLNIASQIALALLGVTYNIDPADSFAITKPGMVAIPDLSTLETGSVLSKDKQGAQTLNAKRYTANTFGLVGQAAYDDEVENIPVPGTIFNPDNPIVYRDEDNLSFLYVFYEGTVSSAKYQGQVATNRTVATAASCSSFPVVNGANGTIFNITVRYPEGDAVVELPVANGDTQTTYMHDPDTGANATWAFVEVFEASSNNTAWFYECDVSIGRVVNAVIPEHELGANLTQFVPPAIALQGYGSTQLDPTSNATKAYQFQSYPQGSYFGAFVDGDGDQMAMQLARFSINVVAAAAQANPNMDRRGMVPQRGVVLQVKKMEYVHLILVLTMAVQLAANVVAVVVANRVQVRGHSVLGVAALVRPLLVEVSDRAAMATGKQIAELVGSDVKVQYMPASGGGYEIHVFEDAKVMMMGLMDGG